MMEISVQAVVEEAILYEHNLASLYMIFSSSLSDDSDFWWGLSLSETQHASLLKASQRLFDEEFARETLPADLGLLRASNQSLETTIDRFRNDPPQAEEALRIGLVSELVEPEQLLDRAWELLAEILANGPAAVAATLMAIREGLQKPLDEGLALEAALFSKLCGTAEMREGTSAFLEKRVPRFRTS